MGRDCMGKRAKDTLTGFVGIITAYALYNTGSDRVQLEGVDNSGRPVEWWFDFERIEFL